MDNQEEDNQEQIDNQNEENEEYMGIEDILELIDSDVEERQVHGFRKLREYPAEEAIDLVIEYGIIPRCVEFLRDNTKWGVKKYAAKTLSAVSTGTAEQVLSLLIDDAVVKEILNVLESNALFLVVRAAWTLGNIAKSSALARHIFYDHNVAETILRIMNNDPTEVILMHLSRLVLTLVRCSYRSITFDQQFTPFMLIIVNMLDSILWPVISDVCLALEVIFVISSKLLEIFIGLDGVKRMVLVLARRHHSYIPAALNVLTMIAKCKTEYATAIVQADGVRPLRALLLLPPHKTGCAILSLLNCLVFRCDNAVQVLIDTDVFPVIRTIIRYGNTMYYAPAIDLISTTIFMASKEQIIDLADRFGLMKPFIVMLLKTSCIASLTMVVTVINHLFEVDVALVSIQPPLFEIILAKLISLSCAEDDELSERSQVAIANYAKHFFSDPNKCFMMENH